MNGLVIREPWISLILSGAKTWELRSRGTNVRGSIGLIRKGSGTVVGIAELAGSLPPLTNAAAYAHTESLHRVPRPQQADARARGWITPWVLKAARPLPKPVRYVHRPGAVIWVFLDEETANRVANAI